MAKKDYYDILEVSRSASDEEIKRAYRKLAQEHHPDKGGSHEKFKEINEAYQVLKDSSKRSAYDQYGHAASGGGFDPGRGAAGFGFNGQEFNVDFENFGGGLGDVFDAFFGRDKNNKYQPKSGRDIEVRTRISFSDSVFGANQNISFDRIGICPICKGSGSEPGTDLRTCLTCSGVGQINETRQSFFGVVNQATVCPHCKGRGKIPEKFCKHCHGDGRTKERADIKVKIPAGIKSGATIRLRGEGEAGETGGSPGDLYVVLLVEPDPRFAREGDEIVSDLKIDFIEAALGSEREIETVYGPKKIKIQPGTQSGEHTVLKNLGAPDLNSGRKGDHIVRIKVTIPKHLSRKQKQLLEEFKESGGLF